MRSLVLLVVLVVGILLGGAVSARATVFNVIPSDGVDAPVDEFTDQDELWAYTTADLSGGLVCVIPRPFLQTEEELGEVKCNGNAWGVTFIPGGTSGIWPISQLSDESLPQFLPFQTGCSNFDFAGSCEWEIGVEGTTTRSVPFTVHRCAALECPTRLVPNASTVFKAGRTAGKVALQALCNTFNALSAAQAAAETKQYVDFLVAENAGGVVFTEAVLLKEAGSDYAINLFKKLLTPPGVKVTGSAWASASGFILCAPGLQGTFEKILGDPPDPNFTSVAAPQYADLPPPGDALGADLVTTLDRLNGDSEAMLHAYERYQGADAADSERNVHRQARAISETAFDVVGDTRSAQALLRSVATRSETDPDIRNQLFSGDDFDAFDATFDRIRTSGFTAAEITQFHDGGLTDEEIGRIRERYSLDLSDSGLTADSTLSDALRGLADGLEPTLEPTEAFARNASAVAGETNEAPVASFTATPPSGASPLAVQVASTTAASADGDSLGVTWDFGDGATGTGANAAHTYTADGEYTVTQTVSDGYDSDTTTKTVSVGTPNTAPTASFTATPDHGDVPLDVAFDASGSHDDASIASYAWDFGDGGSGSGATASHTYTTAGAHTATLTVTDDAGAVGTVNKTITAAEPANATPTASFTATPEGGTAPLQVAFDAGGSSDSDGSVAAYAWAFGDGVTGSGKTVTHEFDTPGSYDVVLTVTDDGGATGQTTRTVKVKAENQAPVPADDALEAEGAGVIDALLNDTDPDQDPLTIVATGAPAHGTAACAPLGGCLYTAASGYQGPDSFTYRVRDAEGLEATASVTVTVVPPAQTAGLLRARDDQASTPAGTPVTLHLLANDTGTSLTVTDWTDPHHGSVDCQGNGTCEYQPAAGFSGSDGFTYTVQDEAQAERTADVHLTVAPASAGFAVKVAGAAAPATRASITEGAAANWSAAVAASPAGISGDALAALPRPAVTAALKGPHTLKAGSVRTARGWSVDPAGDDGAVHARVGQDALLGEVSDSIPRPLPAVSQGTGGDGHVPILVGSKVFAFFHHSAPTTVTCVDRATGSLCTGYPKATNQATTNIPGPAAVVGSRIYVHLVPAGVPAETASLALYCWDTAKDRPCGLITVDRLENVIPGGSAPLLIAGKLYFAGDRGRLYCVDPATNALCSKPFLATGLDPSAGGEYDIVGHGTRVFVSRLGGTVACLDVATGATCPGWSLPRSFSGTNVVNRHDPAGKADGVCVLGVTDGTCVTDGDPSAATPITGWPNYEDYYTVTAEAETGTRTLVGTFNSGLGCWDWVTMAACSGGDYVNGVVTVDGLGQPLPGAYGAAWDGSCVVGLGDPGLVFTVDPAAGRAPCTTLGAGTEPHSIDLRDQRCDGTVGSAAWQAVALGDAAAGELASVTVTVRDAATGAVLATKDITGGPLSLAGIGAGAHPAITVEANAISTAGDPAWADAVPPRIRVAWKADPKQLCFETTTKKDCASPVAPIAVSAQVDGSAVKDVETLDLLRGACPPALGALPDREVGEQTPLSFAVAAADPNGGALKFSLASAPPGVSIDAASGRLSWTPTEAQGPGNYDVTVRAADPGGLADQQTFKVRVAEVNRPPALTTPADVTVGAGTPFAGRAVASDPDAPANHLAFSLVGAPAGASVDRGSGEVRWAAVPAGS
ncbi:MAG: PKD domain-containing protein, partial [Solirubrobacteraceae bacterium]